MSSDEVSASAQESTSTPLDANDVEAFLSEHPTFFKHRPELLTAMELPHGGPGAVSLVERQVTLLRERNIEMRNRLAGMTENANTNDALFNGTRETVLALLDAHSTDALADVIRGSFAQHFKVEWANLVWLPAAESLAQVNSAAADKASIVASLVKHQQPFAGVFRAEEMQALFDDAQDEGSAAIAPIVHDETLLGVVAVGSSDLRRYDSTVGTLFLDYIASVISRLPVICRQQ